MEMELREDSLAFHGDSFQESRRRRDHHHHQTLHNNHPHDHQLDRSGLLVSDQPSARISARSINPVRYRECLKNHAAMMGGLVLDGCGEFMPMGEEGTAGALKCAACECHRNFHRKEIEQQSPRPETRTSIPNSGSLHTSSSQRYARGLSTAAAPVMMSFGGGAAAESSSEDLTNMLASDLQESAKKRFRTKFSQEQKEKMAEFAERLGWKIQKQDEQQVQQFCSTVGIKRKIFKVWMHNNKQSIKKKQM